MRTVAIALLLSCLPGAVAFAQPQDQVPVAPAQPQVSSADLGKVAVSARLHTLWMLRDEAEKPGNEFRLNMARLGVRWSPDDAVDAVLEADLDQMAETDPATAVVRDAFVQVRAAKYLRFRMGQFKKPFSRLELRSLGRLEIIDRGLSNRFLIEDLLYGERDLGFRIDGRFGKRRHGLRYYAGVFNGSGRNAQETDLNGSKDFVARIEAALGKRLSLGLNGSLKLFDDPAEGREFPSSAWMSGADARIRLGRFRLLVEGLFGQSWDKCIYAENQYTCQLKGDNLDMPYAWSALALVTYKLPLLDGRVPLALQPALKGEVLTPEGGVSGAQIRAVTPGLNLLIGQHARLMIDGELVLPAADAPAWFEDRQRLLVQLAFDI